MTSDPPLPGWTVTLVCGAAAVGKSRVARGLAARYATPLSEVDDIVTALLAMTEPDQLPVLHYWQTHPETRSWGPKRIAEHHMSVAETLGPALSAVIADHVEFRAPLVLEGDHLLPELVRGFGGAVRAVVVSEPDEGQLIANLGAREPHEPHQRDRARVSRLVDAELTRRTAAVGAPVVLARPWDTVLERTDRALRAYEPGQ